MQKITHKALQQYLHGKSVALLELFRSQKTNDKNQLEEKTFQALQKVDTWTENEVTNYREAITFARWAAKSSSKYQRGDSFGDLKGTECFKMDNDLIAVVHHNTLSYFGYPTEYRDVIQLYLVAKY